MRLLVLLAALLSASPALAETQVLEPVSLTEWKAVYGRIEARDLVSARARIGGTVVELLVSEGDTVSAGQEIATVRDDKLAFQAAALDAQMAAIQSQLRTAQSDLERGESLVKRGVSTAQQIDQLRTAVDVATNQIAALEAQKAVIEQQSAEGAVLAPADGRILTVPTTRGAVILPGEPVATLGGGGFFLRLAIPERHADSLREGAEIQIATDGAEKTGRLVKIYPQIEGGRIIADVEVEDLDAAYVDARVLVRVPVGERQAIAVPASAVVTRSGIDFVTVAEGGDEVERAVVLGSRETVDGVQVVEILSGLKAGDTVSLP